MAVNLYILREEYRELIDAKAKGVTLSAEQEKKTLEIAKRIVGVVEGTQE